MSASSQTLPLAAGASVGVSCLGLIVFFPPQTAADITVQSPETGDSFDLTLPATSGLNLEFSRPFSRLEFVNRTAGAISISCIIGDVKIGQ